MRAVRAVIGVCRSETTLHPYVNSCGQSALLQSAQSLVSSHCCLSVPRGVGLPVPCPGTASPPLWPRGRPGSSRLASRARSALRCDRGGRGGERGRRVSVSGSAGPRGHRDPLCRAGTGPRAPRDRAPSPTRAMVPAVAPGVRGTALRGPAPPGLGAGGSSPFPAVLQGRTEPCDRRSSSLLSSVPAAGSANASSRGSAALGRKKFPGHRAPGAEKGQRRGAGPAVRERCGSIASG